VREPEPVVAKHLGAPGQLRTVEGTGGHLATIYHRGVPRRRILVFNQYYAPAFESTAQLLTQLCEELAADYDVTVVTGVAEGARPGGEVRNGVDVVRVFSTAFERRRLSRRATNYLTYVGSSLWTGLTESRPDLVLCMSDPPFVPAFAFLAARRFRVPYVAIVQDVFPEIAVELGRLRNPLLVRALHALVGLGLRNADRVVAIGETMQTRLVAKGVDPDRIVVIRNWVDATELVPTPKDNEWARQHGLADKFVVMHSGNVGHAQNLDVLVRAATFLRDLDDLRFVIIGGGARRIELAELGKRLEADQVQFLPYQPREVLSESLAAADMHFIGLAHGLSGYVVPSRMNGVLSVGRPVIVAADTESEIVRIVEDARCGIVIEPGRPELLAAAIRQARNGAYDLAEMGRNGRAYVEREIDRSVSVARYRELLDEMLE
jgi:glycosyltransferase involved in cell wall biosynthesis